MNKHDDTFYGYPSLDLIAEDLKKNKKVYFQQDFHKLREGDVVVLPDDDTTGHQIGFVVWVSRDKKNVIVRDTQYNEYTDIDANLWKYTGVSVSRLTWLSCFGAEIRKGV